MPEAAGPGDRVLVPASRLPRWLAGFSARHGGDLQVERVPKGWVVQCGQAAAEINCPDWAVSAPPSDPGGLAELAGRLNYAVLVVRRAGYLVAVVEHGRVVASKVSSRHIHGRTAAGGWSQKRYSRRRANQADEIAVAAATGLEDMSSGHGMAFLATGGDRQLVAAALAELPTAGVAAQLPTGPHFEIGTPTKSDLAGLHDRVTGVWVLARQP